MSFEIREMTADDHAAVRKLTHQRWEVQDPAHELILIARQNDAVRAIGMYSQYHEEEFGPQDIHLFCRPGNEGAYPKMIQMFNEFAKNKAGAQEIVVQVNEADTQLLQAYRSNGYKDIGHAVDATGEKIYFLANLLGRKSEKK